MFYAFSASSETIDFARTLLGSGQYAEAMAAGQNLKTSEGYALAAEALSAQLILGRFEDLNKYAHDALLLAEKAVELDPNNENAHVQYALAYGVMTRTTSVFTAWRKKYPTKSFEIVQALRERYPDNPKADALLGAWHLGVVRKAGEKNGQKWYGASVADGMAAFNSALKGAPQDILIASTFAAFLCVLEPEQHSSHTRALLEWVANAPEQTEMDRDIKARMAGILAAFDTPEVASKMSEDFLEGLQP